MRGFLQRKLKFRLRICSLPRLLSREFLQTFRKEVPKRSVGGVVIYEDISCHPFKSSWQMASYK